MWIILGAHAHHAHASDLTSLLLWCFVFCPRIRINMDISSSSSSSSSSGSEEMFLNIVLPEVLRTHPKNVGFVEDTTNLYSDMEFKDHFRLSKYVVTSIAKQLEYYPKSDTGNLRIPSEKCVMIFLWYAGHEAASFRDVADRFNVTLSTLHELIENLSLFISNMSKTVIKWPSEEEKLEIVNDFKNMGFPNVLGCMDGSHIRIDKPTEDHISYYNRKKFYSIQMQIICDNKRKIRDVFIGYPGSVHDSRVFRNSPIFDSLQEKCGDAIILADSAYPCLRNVLTPYRDTGALTPVEKNFNKTLSHCRVVIEHTFGILKQKFRQLYHLKLRNIAIICHFIRACCVLHNLGIDDDIIEWDVAQDDIDANFNEVLEDEENEGNLMGHNFRNYIASVLFVQNN